MDQSWQDALASSEGLRPLVDEVLIAGIGKVVCRHIGGQKKGRVPLFARRTKTARGASQENCTDLFGPKIVFRHEDKTAKGAQAPGRTDAPSCFLKDFTMQGGDRMFARIDAAARQLNVVVRFDLMGQKQSPTERQDRIDPGAKSVPPIPPGRFTDAFQHMSDPLDPSAPRLYTALIKERHTPT